MTFKKSFILYQFFNFIISFILSSLFFRLRRRRSKSKKYGIITTPASDLEMAPLDQGDDDDEDLTVFEMNGKPK